MKTLSIIVPVYNLEEGGKLRFCLDSLLAQSLPAGSYEIIAVDDCSTDGSYRILEEYARRFPGRVRALRTPENLRQGGAKNLGLAHAEGAWLSFVDGDDFVAPSCFEELLRAAEESGADLVSCDVAVTDRQSLASGRTVKSGAVFGGAEQETDAGEDALQAADMTHALCARLILDGGFLVAKLYRRELVLGREGASAKDASPNEAPAAGEDAVSRAAPRARVFPERMFYEDNAVGPAFLLRSGRYAYLSRPLYYYYQHGASTVHTVTKERLHDRLRAARLMLSSAHAGGCFKEYRTELEYEFTRLFYINTLFSAMQARPPFAGCYAFTAALMREMKDRFPAFAENPYFLARTDAEEQRLIRMQKRSQLLFYLYYRALWAYRRLAHKA